MFVRAFSTGRRVLCSLQKLKNLQGKGIKFSLQPIEEFNRYCANANAKPRRPLDRLATGFVFYHETMQQPRAFVNRCPHALLELDFDDSDFFCEGFIHCKAHAAFFDPDTGICLQGPVSTRKELRGLEELEVEVDEENVVLLSERRKAKVSTMPTSNSQQLEDYKRMRKQDLSEALAKRSDTLELIELQHRLHEKTMARVKHYERMEQAMHKPKK